MKINVLFKGIALDRALKQRKMITIIICSVPDTKRGWVSDEKPDSAVNLIQNL